MSTQLQELPVSICVQPGEYCFLYLGDNNNAANMQIYGQNNMKVFDFGIAKWLRQLKVYLNNK